MRRRVLTAYLVALIVFLAGLWTGMQSASQAQTSTYLSASPIPSTQTATQLWMAQPFCLRAWWGPTLCSEAKGDEHHIGAGWKLDLPGPAWIALEGQDEHGWAFHSIAKTNEQAPGANFVAVSGPTLVTVLLAVTPSPTMPPPASVTPSPPFGVTTTPTARVTPTPSPSSPPGGGIPTLSPAQHAAFTVRCDFASDDFTMTIWGSYGLVYSVPGEWCSEVDRGAASLLERMARDTPSRVEVRP